MSQPTNPPKTSGNPYIKTNFKSSWEKWVYNSIKVPFKRFLGLLEKEFRVLFKDASAMIIAFALPVVVILILTLGVSQTLISTNSNSQSNNSIGLSKAVPIIGLINYDTSSGFPGRDLSEELIQMFMQQQNEGNCQMYITTNQSVLEQMMGTGSMNAFVIIPQLFEFNLSIHFPAIITVVFDAIDAMNLQAAQGVVQDVVDEFQTNNNFTGVFVENDSYVNYPTQAQTFYAAAPILIPLMLFGLGALTTTQCVVSDIPKDRMVLTPTNKREMLAAKFMANFGIMVMLGLLFMTTTAIVGLQILSSWWEFFLVVILLAMNAVSVGILISTISRTPLAAFQYFIFVFLFQTIVVFFVQDPNITALIPTHNGYEMVMNVILRGQSFWSIRQNLENLLIETALFYTVAYYIFKQQKNLL